MIKILLHLLIILLSVNSLPSLLIDDIDYDISQSQQFQKYCVITHCHRQILQNWNCKLCKHISALQQIVYVENNLTNIVGLLGYHPKLNAIVMIFRGTEDIKNWIQDFSYYQIPYPKCANCKIHEGFYASYLSVALQIRSYIEKSRSKHPDAMIYGVGSSMGGAVAIIAALQVQITFGNVAEIHVFGCPRVGDINFVKYLTQKIKSIRRVIHNRDIVPHVPLTSQNYHHPAYEVWFDQHMQNFKICDDSGEDSTCSNSFYPYFNALDHLSYWQKPNTTEIC